MADGSEQTLRIDERQSRKAHAHTDYIYPPPHTHTHTILQICSCVYVCVHVHTDISHASNRFERSSLSDEFGEPQMAANEEIIEEILTCSSSANEEEIVHIIQSSEDQDAPQETGLTQEERESQEHKGMGTRILVENNHRYRCVMDRK